MSAPIPVNDMSWEVLNKRSMADAKRMLKLVRSERAQAVRHPVNTDDALNPWGNRYDTYAAAKADRLTGGWFPVNEDVNKIIGAASWRVRARVRQLVRDFPYFKRAVDIITDYVVGEGIMFQSRIASPDGTLYKQWIQAVEDAFSFWADEADFAGKLHYYEMMRLAKRQDVESGEFLIIKRAVKDRSAYLPYHLQMVEAEECRRPWELMFFPISTKPIGMVWTSNGPVLMCEDPKYPGSAVSSWRLRQLRELGKQLHKEDTAQFYALMEEITNRKARGTWIPDKYEGAAA
jgi:hypothetical protein